MVRPAALDDLSREGRAAWGQRIAAEFASALLVQGHTDPPSTLSNPSAATELRSIDWPAEPAHAVRCLGRSRAHRLLDWSTHEGDIGRLRFQDEYLEWRVAKTNGEITRIEMTTELPEYWETLATYSPSTTLELASAFAMTDVTQADIYGTDGVERKSPAERASAFRRTMLPSSDHTSDGRAMLRTMSRFNDGTDGICCMIHPDNNLFSLLRLTVSSLRPLLVVDKETGRTRFATGPEAISALDVTATTGRNSDPLLVERLVRFATEQRQVVFEDPIGVYIRGFQIHELAQPDGSDVPSSWVSLSRGPGRLGSDREERHQRLTLALPDDIDFAIGDLVVRRTGERLQYGGQLAALVQLALFIRTSPSTLIDESVIVESDSVEVNCDIHMVGWSEFSE